MRILWLIVAIAGSLCLANEFSAAQRAEQPSTKRIVIAAGTVLDGRGGIQRNTRVVVEGTKIASIDREASPVTYDMRAATLMPGWIDTHVHINWHFGPDGKSNPGINDEPDEVALYAAEAAWVTLQGGFTTLQSLGASIDRVVRDRIEHGMLPGARIFTSLHPITNRSGSPDELRALVGKMKADGADLIKLFATGGLSAGGGQTMSDEQIQAACGETNCGLLARRGRCNFESRANFGVIALRLSTN